MVRRFSWNSHSTKPITEAHTRRRFLLETLESRDVPAAYLVNALGDAGIGTGLAGDIRYVINQANLSTGVADTVSFSLPAGSVITLSGGELPISDTLSIFGPGAGALSISGNNTSRIFSVNAGTSVLVRGLTLTAGNASAPASATPGDKGGHIFNGGNLTVQNSVFTNGIASGTDGTEGVAGTRHSAARSSIRRAVRWSFRDRRSPITRHSAATAGARPRPDSTARTAAKPGGEPSTARKARP